MPSREIAIVVIGRNEGDRLIRCLRSVRSEVNRIAYVDSGSTDGSVAVAKEFDASVVELDTALPFTAARARNEGFAALLRKWPDIKFVQFIDGDCELVHGWIEAALTFMHKRKDVAIVCGRRRERFPERSVYNSLCDAEWATTIGEATACGGDALVCASAFQSVGGYQPRLIAGEEPELCIRLRERGWKIWRLDMEMTIHDAAMLRFRQWWIRAVRSGYGYAEVVRLHRKSRFGIWRKEIRSAILWGGLGPTIIALAGLVQPLFFVFALIYPFQLCRMAYIRGVRKAQSWILAFFILLAQFASFQGILRFIWNWARRRPANLIEYKKLG